MEGRVLYTGKTKDDIPFLIRSIKEADIAGMFSYINTLSQERTFIRFQGEEITFAQEEMFVKSELQRIDDHMSVMLLVLVEDTIIGIANVDLKDKVESHEGILGISLAKEYRGKGIGKVLLSTIIDEAKKHMPKLEVITLGVFATNSTAISMYEKLGFKEYGRLPKGIFHKGDYVDHVHMYRRIRE